MSARLKQSVKIWKLAKDLGLNGYATPAGGCLLTDPSFSKRLVELLAHNELNLENLELLKVLKVPFY